MLLLVTTCVFQHLWAVEVIDTKVIVQGYVRQEESKEPLPGVTISIKGTTVGTLTDATGHYVLFDVPVGKVTVVASGIGYTTKMQTIELQQRQNLNLDFTLQSKAVELDGVVVSANRSETRRRLAPTLVQVLTSKLFENINANNLSQGLSFQPGVRVETNCQNCGFQQVRINGLEGPYTQILIDSRPIFSSLAGIYGLEQIPANMIERVEVMRGGGSALFGASAIAGTINIITKEPLQNQIKVSHSTMAVGGWNSWAHNTTLNATLISQNRKMGVTVLGTSALRDGFDANQDGFTEMPKLRNQTLGIRGYVKTGTYSKLTAEYHHIGEYRRGGDSLSLPPHQANIAEQLLHDIHSGNIKYDWVSPNEKHHLAVYLSAENIHRDSYYGADRNPNAYGHTRNVTWMTGVQHNLKFDKLWFMPAEFTSGAEFNQDVVTDEMWGYQRYIHQNVRTSSIFAQNEWKNKQWSLLLGARLDKHSLLKTPVLSPRINLRYNPSDNFNIRAGYAQGFRAPQAFDEDLHIENVGGTVSMIRLSPQLKAEQSQSFTLSADMYRVINGWQANLMLEGFYTKIANVFALRNVGEENGILIKERYNEQSAYVFGTNIEGRMTLPNSFSFQGGITLQRSLYKDAVAWSDDVTPTRRIFRTPDVYGYFTTTYQPINPLTIALSGTYTGSMLVEHNRGYIDNDVTKLTQEFMVLNLKLSYSFALYAARLQLNGGIQNIFNAYQKDFDLGKNRDAAYIYGPGNPRQIFVGLTIEYE